MFAVLALQICIAADRAHLCGGDGAFDAAPIELQRETLAAHLVTR